MTKSNTGSLAINIANDYIGGSAINSGAVLVGNNQALGKGTVTLNGGSLTSDGFTARTLTNSVVISTNSVLGDLVNTGTLTLAGSVNFNGGARNLTINSPAVFSGTLTNGDLNLKTGDGALTFSGVSGTTSSGSWQVGGGDLIISGGTLNRAGELRVGNLNPDGISHLIITNGGIVNIIGSGNNMRIGNDQAPAADPTSTNILDVAGTLAWATNSGGDVLVGYAGLFSQINLLAGGWLQVAAISSGTNNSELNLNGGTLSPTTNQMNYLSGLTNAFVRSGGVVFDTKGFNIGVAQPLLDGGGNGGLTKAGAGTLYFTAGNTYTGLTTVSNGTLLLDVAIARSASIKSGATLGGHGTVGGSLTLLPCAAVTNLQGSPLNVSGSLIASGNTMNVATLSALGLGDYVLMTYNPTGSSGSLSSAPVISGAGLATGLAGTIVTVGGTVTLHVASAVVSQPAINQVRVSSGNLILQGTNGTPATTYSIITATNLNAPLANWTTNATGAFTAGGTFSNAIPLGSELSRFFQIKTP